MADDTSTDTTDETETDSTDTGGGANQQPDVPPEVKRALSKANKEAETLRLKLKDYEDRDKTEAQKLEERATQAERAAADAGLELSRFRVAAATGIPASLAGRLQGNTEEELTADAESLKELLGVTSSAASFDGGARPSGDKPKDMNDLIRRSIPGNR